MSLVSLITPFVKPLVEKIWDLIKNHVGYCLKPNANINYLTTAANELKNTRRTLDERIQAGKGEGKRPNTQVKKWLDTAQSIETDVESIEKKYITRRIHLFGCSWNCWFNYTISKDASKKRDSLVKIQDTAPCDDAIFSLLPPVGREMPMPPIVVGQEAYYVKVLDCIREGTTNIIGIYGMGGSGKTTLLTSINNYFVRDAAETIFDHVIFVEVGRQANLHTLQQDIASQVGLLLKESDTTASRAICVYNFLRERKYLLLLDNLWEELDLQTIGIPQAYQEINPQNKQVIVITTRSLEVCCRMRVPRNISIQLECLKSHEAWDLFRANANVDIVSNTHISVLAKTIVAKCDGLPLALKVVGKAMASKVALEEWEHTVKLLERSHFHEVRGMEDELFSVLYISYKSLSSDVMRKCFLFYALLTKSCHVHVTSAIKVWLGHGFLGERDDFEVDYLTGYSIIGSLKQACLLETDSRGENFLNMHEIVRDLALWIVTSEPEHAHIKKWLVQTKKSWIEEDQWSSAERIGLYGDQIETLPGSCNCTELLTLILHGNIKISMIPAGFLSSMQSLTYLDLGKTSIQVLPADIGALANLQFLDLSFTPIRSLPEELCLLKKLRYLLLSGAHSLKAIPYGLISSLSMLRMLELSATKCLMNDTEGRYIRELECSTTLRCLGFSIGDVHYLHRICNLPNVSFFHAEMKDLKGLRSLCLSPTLIDKMKARHLRSLSIFGSQDLAKLEIGDTNIDSDWSFTMLYKLTFSYLNSLERVNWNGMGPHIYLPKLRWLRISECQNLKDITWIKQLPSLEEVYLLHCRSMLELVKTSDEDSTASFCANSFPRLKMIGLSDMQNLESICDGTLAFPSLVRMLVTNCPKLVTLPPKLVSGGNRQRIYGEREWWEKLEWEDPTLKDLFLPFFTEIPGEFHGEMKNIIGHLLQGNDT